MLVQIPADRVLFTGDTVVAGYFPNLEYGGPAEWNQWLKALALVRRMNPSIIVPGHGPVLEGGEIGKEIERVEGVLEQWIDRGTPPASV